MNVYKRNGRWTVDFWVTQKDGTKTRIRKASPINKKAAAVKFGRALQESEQDRALNGTVAVAPTLQTFSEEFLEYQASAVRPSTLEQYGVSYERHILPELGQKRLDQIDARAIDKFRVGLINKGLAAGTVNNHLAHLRRGLSLARKWGLIQEVPHLEKIKLKTEGRLDFLTDQECALMAEVALAESPMWHAWFMTCVRAGLRAGESLGLQWGDLDFHNRRIYVSRSWRDQTGLGPTKSGKSREVPVARDLLGILQKHKAWLENQRELDSDTWVFPRWALENSHRSRGPVSYRGCRRFLSRASARAGLRKITPHVLRHTFGSHSAMKGVPMRVLQAWMGHADIKQTMQYSHLSEDVHGDFIDRIAGPDRPEERAE